MNRSLRLLRLIDADRKPTPDFRVLAGANEDAARGILRDNAKELYAPVLTLPPDASLESFWMLFYLQRTHGERLEMPSKATHFAVGLFKYVELNVNPAWHGAPRSWHPDKNTIRSQRGVRAMSDTGDDGWARAIGHYLDIALPTTESEEVQRLLRTLAEFRPSTDKPSPVSAHDRKMVETFTKLLLAQLENPS